MSDILVWVWILYVASGLGLLLLPRRLWAGVPELRLATGFGLGCGVLIGLTFLAGMTGTLHGVGKWGILPLGTVAAGIGWARSRRLLGALRRGLFWKHSRLDWILWILLVTCITKSFLAALTPEVRHDALDYHIQFPNLYAVKGRISNEPWSVMSYLPYNIEMLYTLGLLWAGDTAGKLLHFTLGTLTALAAVGLGKRWFRPSTGLFAAVLFLLQPQVAMISNTCFNDLGRAMFETVALALWFELWESRRRAEPRPASASSILVLLGVFAGLSLGVKWTTFPVFFAPFLVVHGWFLLRHEMRWSRKLCEMGLLFVLPLAVFSPWCYRSYRFTGNPIYPFLNTKFGLTDPASARAEEFFQGLDPPPETHSIQGLLAYWQGRLRDIGLAGSVLVYLFLLLVPLAVLARWALPEDKAARGPPGIWKGFPFDPAVPNLVLLYVVMAGLGFLLFTYNADGRFLMPAYPLMALLVARSVEHIVEVWMSSRGYDGEERGFERRPAFGCLLIVLLLAALAGNSIYHQINAHRDLNEPWLPVLGAARRAFMADRYPLLPVLNDLPRGSLVLGAGFPARVPYISKVKAGSNVVEERIRHRPYSGRDLWAALRDLGVTHLIEPSAFPLPEDAREGLKEHYATLVAGSGEIRLYLLKEPKLLDSYEEN